MGAVKNAAMLLGSTEWRDLVTAATIYTAREVFSESGTDAVTLRRKELARRTIASPGPTVAYMLPLTSTLPAIAVPATTVAAVPEDQIISAVAGLWTPVANEMIALPEPPA